MAFGNLFGESPATSQQISTLSPQQRGLKSAVNQQALSLLNNADSYGGFEPIAQRAREQFQTKTIPTLAERFTALGQGGQRSSAFQGALGQAGSDLESQLAALQSQYGLSEQQLNNQLLSNLLGYSLTPEVETLINPSQPGFFQSAATNAAPLLGQLLPLLLGSLLGPLGSAGGGILSLLGGNRG